MKKITVTDLTTNTTYASGIELVKSLGVTKEDAVSYSNWFKKNIKKNDGVYRVQRNTNTPMKAIDGHKFVLGGANEGNVVIKAEKPQFECDLRILPKPAKNIPDQYVNIRMNKGMFRFVREQLGMDTGTNEIAIVDINTGIIYPSITKCVKLVGKKLNKTQQEVLYGYIRKSCIQKTPIAVEKNKNNCLSYMSEYEGHTFNYLSDHKVAEIPTLKKNHLAAVRNEIMIANEAKEKANEAIITLQAQMDNLKKIAERADATIATYSALATVIKK